MNTDTFELLADSLDKLPNGFPRTPSRVEIPLLQRIFTEEEATLAANLAGEVELVDVIAKRVGLEIPDARTRLMKMVRRGLVWLGKKDGKTGFRLAPYVVGIYEAQLEHVDREFAELSERYMADGGAQGMLGIGPALQRVVPAEDAVNPEWVLPYDDVRAILMKAEVFSVVDCICRVQRKQTGHDCDFPLHTCLSFSHKERAPRTGDVSREEALALLKKAAELGLVHTVSNNQKIGYVCNCCGCCCAILRGINEWGIENSVAHANYHAVLDEAQCISCGLCVERCPVNAISQGDDVPAVERVSCIGCGACATGCPSGAIELQLKPEPEIIAPPTDYATWEEERRLQRAPGKSL